MLVVLVIAVLKNRLGWRGILIPIVAITVVVGPYLIFSYQTWGDPMYASNIHAVWWRNYEFNNVRKIACPECAPASATLAGKEMYGGEPTTSAHYVFGMHTPPELITATWRGFNQFYSAGHDAFLIMSGWERAQSPFVSVFYYVGLLSIISKPYRFLPLISFAFTGMLLFSFELGMPNRLFSTIAPFIIFCLAEGVGVIVVGVPQIIQTYIRQRV